MPHYLPFFVGWDHAAHGDMKRLTDELGNASAKQEEITLGLTGDPRRLSSGWGPPGAGLDHGGVARDHRSRSDPPRLAHSRLTRYGQLMPVPPTSASRGSVLSPEPLERLHAGFRAATGRRSHPLLGRVPRVSHNGGCEDLRTITVRCCFSVEQPAEPI
jgi:hypothetical protein